MPRCLARAVEYLDPKEVIVLPLLVFVGTLAVVAPQRISGPDSELALALSALLIVVWCVAAVRCPAWHQVTPRPVRLVRNLIALVLCLGIYPSLRWAVPLVHGRRYDSALAAADRWLFHGRDPLPMLDPLVSPPLTTVLAIAYSCAWMPAAALGLYLYLQGRDQELSDVLTGLVLVHSVGFLGYVLVPATGPWRELADRFTVPLGDSPWVTHYYAYNNNVDAFPSLHIASTLLVGCFAWRDWRLLWWLASPLLVAIGFSTLYLRWHYVVDVLAGLALALAVRWASPRINAAWAAVQAYNSTRPSAETETDFLSGASGSGVPDAGEGTSGSR